ncbi:MAG: redoxin domain-containing protein [Anaerolineales bacterium]|nr:redoxin domain-containing protein [Anaerolineales bacterium]
MKRQILLLLSGLLIGLAAGIAFFFGLNQVNPLESFSAEQDPSASLASGTSIYAPEKGNPAPDFALENLDGERIALETLRGKVVLLNFWATWCGPCRVEMPALESRHQQYPEQLAVVGIDFDEAKEDVAAFVEEFALTFPILLDPGAVVQDAYRVRGYPTSVFLDEDGTVQIVHIGIMSEDQLDAYLQELGVTE